MITNNGSISGIVSTSGSIVGIVSTSGSLIGFTDKPAYVDRDPYLGEYEATSLVANDYELETNNKRMTDNVTIKKIPYEAVENPQGGNTVTIGGY